MQDPRAVGDYTLNRTVGKGSYAQVWQAQHKVTGLNVSIKVLAKASLTTAEGKLRSAREVNLHRRLHHPFITEFFETIEDKGYLYFVLEFVDGVTVQEYVQAHGKFSEDAARLCFTELIAALDYLHRDRHLVHGNLNARNVLVDKDMNIRLTDFGLSSDISVPESEFVLSSGDPDYTCPEVIKGQPYTVSSDIWSAGILLFLMTVGCLPYEDPIPERLLQKIVFSDVFYPPFLSPVLLDLLKKLLVKDPDARITLDGIKKHPWLQQGICASLATVKTADFLSSKSDIDKQIMAKMEQLGFDVKGLAEALGSGKMSSGAAVYRQFMRQKERQDLREYMEKMKRLHAPSCVRPAFSFGTKLTMGRGEKDKEPREMELNKSQPLSDGKPLGPRSLGISFRRNRTMQVPFPVQLASKKLAAGCVRSSTPCGQ